jgi:hypothetical protein
LNIFLDSSVAIAASLSATGASRQVFDLAGPNEWSLIISPWVLREVRENLRNKPEAASGWKSLRRRVGIEPDVLVLIGRLFLTSQRTSRSWSRLLRMRMFFSRSTGATSVS